MWLPLDPDIQTIRAGLLLIPCFLLCLIILIRQPTALDYTGAFLATLWNLVSVLLVNRWAAQQGWWIFPGDHLFFLNSPIDVLFGWAILWGPLCVFLGRSLSLPLLTCTMIYLDILLMPQLDALVFLGEDWLIGEVVAITCCFLPGQFLARYTIERTHLYIRAILQAICYGVLVLIIIPAIIFDYLGTDYISVLQTDIWFHSFKRQTLILAIFIGLVGLHEFVVIGKGTPIPFDPPRRLVMTGPYAYLANPQQLSTILMWIFILVFTRNFWLLIPIVCALAFTGHFVPWFHQQDTEKRFGEAWKEYRREVPNWIPRWKPYVPTPSTMYFAEGCGLCQDVLRWIKRLQPIGLEYVAAEDHPREDLRRVTYKHGTTSIEENGVVAIARALEHVNLAYAITGWLMRLPLIKHLLQFIVDATAETPGICYRRIPAPRK